MNKTMIMGRNTYESMPKNLEGRKYIVLTKKNIKLENAEVFNSKSDLIKNLRFNEKYIICGGEQIYKLFIDDVETMFLTHIDDEHEADTYFPKFDYSKFNKELLLSEEENNIKFKQYKYTRIK
jgi:dihydrofolate reductase